MKSILNIIRQDQLNDYQKAGYYKNFRTGAPKVFSEKLLPFFAPVAPYTGTLSITVDNFKLQLITRAGVLCTEIELNTNIVNLTVDLDINQWVARYNGTADILGTIDNFKGGMYRYFIALSNRRNFISEPFWVQRNKFSAILGDFNEDFSDDFNVYQDAPTGLPD